MTRETPPEGGSWLNNGEVHEALRADCMWRAEAAARAGQTDDEARWIRIAENARELRDRAHREGRRRAVNRHVRAQRSTTVPPRGN